MESPDEPLVDMDRFLKQTVSELLQTEGGLELLLRYMSGRRYYRGGSHAARYHTNYLCPLVPVGINNAQDIPGWNVLTRRPNTGERCIACASIGIKLAALTASPLASDSMGTYSEQG